MNETAAIAAATASSGGFDMFSIVGAVFGVLGLFVCWRVYDYIVNGNIFALSLFPVKRITMAMLYPVEHKLMYEDKPYVVYVGGGKAYVPKLKRTIKNYIHRPNVEFIIGYKLDNEVIVDPYFIDVPVPVIYQKEFEQLFGSKAGELKAYLDNIQPTLDRKPNESNEDFQIRNEKAKAEFNQKKLKMSFPVALYASFKEYSGLLSVFRDNAKLEARKIANSTPEDMMEKLKGMAPGIMIALGITFFFIMLAMQSFSLQNNAIGIVTKPLDANVVCNQNLGACQNALIEIIKNNGSIKNLTSSSGGVGGIISGALG